MVKYLIVIFTLVVGISCSKNYDLDPTSMQQMPNDTNRLDIVKECKHLYESKKWEVAVLEFTNNTGYQDMTIKNTQSTTRGTANTVGVGVGVASADRRGNIVGVGVGASKTNFKYSTNSNEFMGQFAPSLGPFAQSVTEEVISQMGGVNLVSRSHLDKILKEQQFQMTLADPNTVMEFGLLSGVKYIVTGSVDNIQAKYVAPTNLRDADSDVGAILSLVSATYDVAASGWFVSADITVTFLDAETGKVMFTKSFKDSKRATQSPNFQPDIIINTAKQIFSNSIKNATNDLVKVFEMTGYVNELRGGKKIAHLNLGSKDGIQPGNVLDVYDMNISTDFLTNEKKCNLVKLNAKIIISNQISEGGSWGFVKGNDAVLNNVKIGSFVKRSSVE